QDSATSKNVEEHAANLYNVSTENIFVKIWDNNQVLEEDEVICYLYYSDEPKNIDSLIW
ncbi:11207_t:CDS:1, partial [Dentiscutata heterogama]